MKLNKLAWCGVVAGSMAAVGCGGGTDPVVDSGTPMPDAFVETMAPISVTYIVDTISIPEAPTGAMMNIAPGFNLDSKVSVESATGDNCEDLIGDYTSPTGETGVDNQLVGVLISTLQGFVSDLDVQAQVEEQIASGSLLLAIRVNDIESFDTDPDGVTLDLFLVKQADCTMDTCPVTGGVMAGQDWVQRAMPLATGLAADIEGGTLRGSVPALPLSFEASGTAITLTISDATVGGDITATSMTNAAIGGEIRIDDVVMLAEMLMPGIGETARGLLVMYADLSPQSADPLTCDSISAGLSFTAVDGNVPAM
jgi:hypothetical protein